jgi:hypothetical protein
MKPSLTCQEKAPPRNPRKIRLEGDSCEQAWEKQLKTRPSNDRKQPNRLKSEKRSKALDLFGGSKYQSKGRIRSLDTGNRD